MTKCLVSIGFGIMPIKKLTQKQIESIRQQAQSGTSVAALCAKYNISSTHVYRIKLNQQRNRRKKTEQMSTYNGWTNHATWLFYLHHQEDIENWYQDHSEHGRQNHAEQHIREYFEEMYGELIDGISNIYITDVINSELGEVNWHEILKTVTEE